MKHVKLFYGIVGTHIDPYGHCQCHVTSEIVSRLLGDAISLMKHVKLYPGIFLCIFLYMLCQCHVIPRTVSLLLDEVISLMKHVYITMLLAYTMSMSCNIRDCLSSSW